MPSLGLTGWDNFAYQPKGNSYFALAESVVFFSLGIVYKVKYRKAQTETRQQGPTGQISN